MKSGTLFSAGRYIRLMLVSAWLGSAMSWGQGLDRDLEKWLSGQKFQVRSIAGVIQLTHRQYPPMTLVREGDRFTVEARIPIPYRLRARERALTAALNRLADSYANRGHVETSPAEVLLTQHYPAAMAPPDRERFWTQWLATVETLADEVAGLDGQLVAPPPNPLETWTIGLAPGISLTMVWIPATEDDFWMSRHSGANTFMMGSPVTEPGRDGDEVPHPVSIPSGFWLARTEVTRSQWDAVMTHSETRLDELEPVEVSRQEADQLIIRLNVMFPAKGFRLPTEAEWEYACRAGTTTAYSFGDVLDPDYACTRESGRREPMPVGSLKPNAWDLFDMHGNLAEWVGDEYQAYLAPVTDEEWVGTHHSVFRGGSYLFDGRYARSAFRGGGNPAIRYPGVGLRIARDDVP
ncbi:MAG: formylglycine-generating enzyme family protein [Verrucomicrobia bacterium]|nr:formylglycine-generating enzyme family protein [Verrucomicrobiota bacterium]